LKSRPKWRCQVVLARLQEESEFSIKSEKQACHAKQHQQESCRTVDIFRKARQLGIPGMRLIVDHTTQQRKERHNYHRNICTPAPIIPPEFSVRNPSSPGPVQTRRSNDILKISLYPWRYSTITHLPRQQDNQPNGTGRLLEEA